MNLKVVYDRIRSLFGLLLSLKRILKIKAHDESTLEGQSDERYRKILLSGGSALAVKVISISINLITVPLTLGYLGPERYGLWMAISSIMTLMAFADLGLGNGLLNAIAKAKGTSNAKSATVAVSSTFFILLFIALTLFILFLMVYPFVNWAHVFNVSTQMAISEAGYTVFVLVLVLLVNMPLGVVQRIQEGNQEGYRFQLYQILGSLISFIGLLLCVYFKTGLPWLVLSFSIGSIVAVIINGTIIFRRRYAYLLPRWAFFELNVGKSLVNTGLVFFVLQIFTLLANASDNIIIAKILGPASVASYEIVKKMFLFSMITQFIIQPLWPAFGAAMESGDMTWVKKTLKNGIVLSMVVGALISLPLLLVGKQIISVWVGPAFEPSWSLLLGFYMFIFIANYGGVMSTFLNSGSLLKKQTLFIGLASITSVSLKIILAKEMGVSGVIWATVIGYSAFYIYPSYKLSINYINSKVGSDASADMNR